VKPNSLITQQHEQTAVTVIATPDFRITFSNMEPNVKRSEVAAVADYGEEEEEEEEEDERTLIALKIANTVCVTLTIKLRFFCT
jgi:hypothetical protein